MIKTQFLGIKLTKLRKNKNLTQREMAAIINIPLRSYQSYEENKCEPCLAILLRLCAFHQISITETGDIKCVK